MEATGAGRDVRRFVSAVIARSDARILRETKVFEEGVVLALHAVESWLEVFGERVEEELEDDDEEEEDDSDDEEEVEEDEEDSDDEEEEEDDDDEERKQKDRAVEAARELLRALISHSLLPTFVHVFLQNRSVSDWLKHSEIYVLILGCLERMVDNGLGKILDEPMAVLAEDANEEESLFGRGDGMDSIAEASPYHWRLARMQRREREAVGGGSTSESSSGAEDDLYSSEEDAAYTETDATSPDEDSDADEEEYEDKDDDEEGGKRRTWHAADYAFGGRALGRERGVSIKMLVAKLEEHRGPLMAFGATVKFQTTKGKVERLCDGISMLLLQQVMC